MVFAFFFDLYIFIDLVKLVVCYSFCCAANGYKCVTVIKIIFKNDALLFQGLNACGHVLNFQVTATLAQLIGGKSHLYSI